MITEFNHPIHSELDISPLISDVAPDSFIYTETLLWKKFEIFSLSCIPSEDTVL